MRYDTSTLRNIFRKINGKIARIRTQEHPGFAPGYHFMGALLDQIISDCASEVINFSISAAHFIEIDWCYKKSKRTLGIAYVRAVSGLEKDSCDNLLTVETDDGFYSVCKMNPLENRTAWDCVRISAYCPFLGQDISKNVVEYFFRGKDMEIMAVENIGVLQSMIDKKYPKLASKELKLPLLDYDIMKDDEIVFTKDAIYFILSLKKLSLGSYLNRLSPMKLLVLLQKTPGWSDSKASNENRTRYFIARNLKNDELISCLKGGFVDIDRIGKGFGGLALHMKERGYVETMKTESTTGIKCLLVKLKSKGRKLAKMYSSL